jgi:hypothetical protein
MKAAQIRFLNVDILAQYIGEGRGTQVSMRTMKPGLSALRKCAFGFALLFLAVYSLDYVPGIMAPNGKMFGLFSMTTFVDIGHLGLGLLALISGLIGQRAARIYFWFLGFFYAADVITYAIRHLHTLPPVTNLLVNLPHILVSTAAFLVAINVDKHRTHAAVAQP